MGEWMKGIVKRGVDRGGLEGSGTKRWVRGVVVGGGWSG